MGSLTYTYDTSNIPLKKIIVKKKLRSKMSYKHIFGMRRTRAMRAKNFGPRFWVLR